MPPESMVDALAQVSTLLKPNGLLIDIHPNDTILPIYVQVGNKPTQVGEIDVESKFAKYRRADHAIDQVVRNGLYSIDHKEVVDFIIYFDTIAECRQYLREEWSNAKLPESSWRHMTSLMEHANELKQIYYSEAIKFCCLSPNPIL